MVTTPQKIPPPPQLTGPEWQSFNRWLLEVTNILAAAGGLDPSTIPGYDALQTQVTQNTSDIASLQGQTGGNTGAIAALQLQINNLILRMGAAESNITTLLARNQVFNGTAAPAAGLGIDGDWFYNRSGAAGARLYIKVAGAWAAQAI